MISTDFDDYAPALKHTDSGVLAECEHFRLEKRRIDGPTVLQSPGDFAIVTVVQGAARCGNETFRAGDFYLLAAGDTTATSPEGNSSCTVLVSTIPETA